ncbi:MAG: hypothetical protein L6R40_007267 [Gallowayella cf. fulva]|nr:MAG: hypothetical protein L6R40_007267 [Xanthomendoza cf. fulva]
MPDGLAWAFVSISFALQATAQVTDFVPFNSLPQYRILGGCPKTYLDREVYSQFTSYLCDATQRTAECICTSTGYDGRRTSVGASIYSVIDAGCTVDGDASRANDVFYDWCTTNIVAIVAASHGIAVPTDSSSGVYRCLGRLTSENSADQSFTVPGPISVSGTITAPPTPTSTDTPSRSPDERDDSPALSTGDIAGIVVAIAIFIGTIIGTILLERRRRAATAGAGTTSHFSWLNKVDHVYFVIVEKAARPFGGRGARRDPRDATQEERTMRQLAPSNGPLALEFNATSREEDENDRR